MKLTSTKKLMLLLGSVVLVAGVSVGAALIQDSAHFLRERALQRLDATARESALRLEEVFDALVQDLHLLASLRSMRAFAAGQEPDRPHMADLLQHALLKHPWYTRVRLFGRSGLDGEVVAVDRNEPAARQAPPEPQRSETRERFLQEVLALPVGEILFSFADAERNEAGAGQQPPVLRAAIALGSGRSQSNRGVLEIDLDMRVVFRRLGGQLLASNQLLVFNSRNGQLLYPRSTTGSGSLPPALGDDISSLPLSTGHTLRHEVRQPGGQRRFLSIQQVALPGRGPQRRFGVAVTLPLSDVRREADYLLIRGAWVTFGLALLAAVAGMLIAQWLTLPMKRLVRLVQGYTAGDPPPRELPLDRQDEIGALARALSEMMGRIREQMGQIKDERARLSGLVETAADAIIVIDTQGVIQQTNSAVSRLFGYAPDELVGSNVKMLMAAEDAQRHDGYLRNYRKTGVGSIIGVGREVVARRANGELIQIYLSVGEFSARGESYYVGILHDITDHKRMEAELVRLAQTDELTGAFNRRHFMGRLEAEIHRSNRYRHPLSMMIIDLDHFKRVNDSYGHAVGDLALRAVVELLRSELREQDELARLGGDEFAVLLPETRVDTAQGVANRVIGRAASIRIDETEERLSLSIGVAGWKLGRTSGGLLRDADAALYQAKAEGRGRACSLKDGD